MLCLVLTVPLYLHLLLLIWSHFQLRLCPVFPAFICLLAFQNAWRSLLTFSPLCIIYEVDELLPEVVVLCEELIGSVFGSKNHSVLPAFWMLVHERILFVGKHYLYINYVFNVHVGCINHILHNEFKLILSCRKKAVQSFFALTFNSKVCFGGLPLSEE